MLQIQDYTEHRPPRYYLPIIRQDKETDLQDGITQPKLLWTQESQQVQMIGHPDLTVVEDPKHEDSPIATFNLLIAKMGRIHFLRRITE